MHTFLELKLPDVSVLKIQQLKRPQFEGRANNANGANHANSLSLSLSGRAMGVCLLEENIELKNQHQQHLN